MTSILAVSAGGGYVDLPCPSYGSYTSVPNEVVKAGTNTKGVLYKDRIRIRHTIAVGWNCLTAEEKNSILSLTGGNSFQVRYFDCEDSSFKYGKFYRGDDLAITPILRYNGAEFGGYNVTMTMVEFRCHILCLRSTYPPCVRIPATWTCSSLSG